MSLKSKAEYDLTPEEIDAYMNAYIDKINEKSGTSGPEKKSVTEWLDDVRYSPDPDYVPSAFALDFINFIKLVNGSAGEENKSPVLHYRMLDKVAGSKEDILNLVHRGASKTTLFGEYMILYLAVYEGIPNFGKIPLGIYVSDSIENGVKNMRKNLEFRWENSDFLKKYLPIARFTDIRWSFENIAGTKCVFKGYGAKALSLDSKLYMENKTTTIGECKIGDKIFGADGKLSNIIEKSTIFHKPMKELVFADGRRLKVSVDHINPLIKKVDVAKRGTIPRHIERIPINITTEELCAKPRIKTGKSNYHYFTKVPEPIEYSNKTLLLDPYLLGLALGDGSMTYSKGLRIRGLREDIHYYASNIPYEYTIRDYIPDSKTEMSSISIHGITSMLRDLGVAGVTGQNKFIPNIYMTGSIKQRLALLAGLLDTDGSCSKKDGRVSFSNISKYLTDSVAELVRGLGGVVSYSNREATGNKKHLYRLHIRMEINPFWLDRKRDLFRIPKRFEGLVALVDIIDIPMEPSQCISIDNASHCYLTTGVLSTHNTGVRGAKEMGTRPYLAILDDLISDEDARSDIIISAIEDTVYKAVDYALHPKRKKIIWSGTPFNAKDPLYKAVESGAWYVNVYPVCEKFPCTKEEFLGSWEDRFTYDYVIKQYIKAKKSGRLDSFYQEMMLRISSEDDMMLDLKRIKWYERSDLFKNPRNYTWYITTDLTTTGKAGSDLSGAIVWALSPQGDKILVDITLRQMDIAQQYENLFRLARKYSKYTGYIEVGVETDGQQGAHIAALDERMLRTGEYFAYAKQRGKNSIGIRSAIGGKKIERVRAWEPEVSLGKLWLPKDLKHTRDLKELIHEMKHTNQFKIASKYDDGMDTLSQLMMIDLVLPYFESSEEYDEDGNPLEEMLNTAYDKLFGDDDPLEMNMNSYVV